MTIQHLYFSPQTEYGAKLRSALSTMESGFRALVDIRDCMTVMIDGDGSSATQFTEVQQRFGFVDTTVAKAAWDELNSVLAKLQTDASVTSVNAALLQVFKKLR